MQQRPRPRSNNLVMTTGGRRSASKATIMLRFLVFRANRPMNRRHTTIQILELGHHVLPEAERNVAGLGEAGR